MIPDEDIDKLITRLFEDNKAEIVEKGYDYQFNNIVYKARDEMKWADAKKVLDLINAKKL